MRGLPTCRRAPPTQLRFLVADPNRRHQASYWHSLAWLLNLRGDALNTPFAVDEPGSPVDLCSDFVHAGTTFKSHYNINFTLFEAPGLTCDDGGHDVLKYTRTEKLEHCTIYACNSYKMGRKPQSRS
jgi:hypothetical protein